MNQVFVDQAPVHRDWSSGQLIEIWDVYLQAGVQYSIHLGHTVVLRKLRQYCC